MPYFLYILRCADKSLYTGITTDVARRLAEHKTGKAGAKYTRAKGAVRIVHTEQFENRSEVSRREAEIKKWSRKKKMLLIQNKNTA